MVVEPLNTAIQIHQWWEHNPSSLLIMAESLRKRSKELMKVAGEVLYFFTRKNFNITDREETIM
uniref:Uncharacterized protein n=1 Tax=Brassica campestris TaxID=3711 RepID=M4FCD3_BRACM